MAVAVDNRYDVIIIGGGLGALACACHLAQDGFHVLLLERQNRAGGYAQNFWRGGYEFDVSQHIMAGMEPDGCMYKLLDKIGIISKLSATRYDPLYVSHFNEDRYALPGYADALIEFLKQKFPAEQQGIDQFFTYTRRIIDDNFRFIDTGEFDKENYFPGEWINRTYKDLLDSCIKDIRLHGILGQLWQSTGLPNDQCAANWMAEVSGYLFTEGNYYIQGGGQRLADAMMERLHELGSHTQLNTLVSKILIKNRTAYGVETQDGETFFAPIIVSGISPIQTYFDLIGRENLAKPFAYLLEHLAVSDSVLTLYIALDKPASTLGFSDHSVFVNHTYDNRESYTWAIQERYTDTDFMLTDYSDAHSHMHPEQAGMLQLLELAPGKPWIEIPRATYDEKKKQVQNILLQKLFSRYPAMKNHISHAELATPRTMLLATRNPMGAIYGWAQTTPQADFGRFSNVSTFKNLYLTGAWCRGGGGGYSGTIITGRFTYFEIMRRHTQPQKNQIQSATLEPEELPTIPPSPTSKTKNQLKHTSDFIIDPKLYSETPIPQHAVLDYFSRAIHEVIHYASQDIAIWLDTKALTPPIRAEFFMVRLVYLLKSLSPNTAIAIQTIMEPKDSGSIQVNQELFTPSNNTLICKLEGRIRINN